MKRVMLIVLMLIWAVVGFAKDVKTVVVTTTPQMHCKNCENKIKGNLRFEKGVKGIETDIEKQTVTIQYDAEKTTVEKIVSGFKKFGYQARVLEAGEKVKIQASETCKNM